DALFLHGHTGDTTCTNLAAVGNELAERSGVLVVDGRRFALLERISLLLDRLPDLWLCHEYLLFTKCLETWIRTGVHRRAGCPSRRLRSEERRVGKESRARRSAHQ